MESLVAESDDINQYILDGTGNPAVLLASLFVPATRDALVHGEDMNAVREQVDGHVAAGDDGAHHTRQRAARTIGSPLRH